MANLSDDEGFLFRKFLAHPKQEIDLTFDDDDDGDDEGDATNVYRVLHQRIYHSLPFGKVRLKQAIRFNRIETSRQIHQSTTQWQLYQSETIRSRLIACWTR